MSEKMPNDHTDHIWKIRMETLMKKKKIIETKEIIDEAIFQYYFEKGIPVPKWKIEKNPQWWVDYLKEIDNKE